MEDTSQIRVRILDLGCGDSARSGLERALAATDGVLSAYVNPATETAYVEVDPAEVDMSTVTQVIRRAGFRAGQPIEA
jgi:copper chaperone CopZ